MKIDKPLIELNRIPEYLEWADNFRKVIRAEALEEAARICDLKAGEAIGWDSEEGGFAEAISFCEDCAKIIRSIK